jgi:putative ABC transport system ATP-binding protein
MAAVVEESEPVAGALGAEGRGAAVRIRGVVKTFGAGDRLVTALHGIDWDVFPNQLTLLAGPSGCGKTTLLSVVAGILDADRGEVDILGTDVTALSDSKRTRFRARNIGFVFQQYNLLPALTAAENAAIPLVINGWKREAAVARASEVLGSLGMGLRTRNLPSQLSGGQQQRVAIARALVHDPGLLVCDEPTAALDHESGAAVMRILKEAASQEGRAVIVVTHDSRVFEYGDRIATMDDGRIMRVEERAEGAPWAGGH